MWKKPRILIVAVLTHLGTAFLQYFQNCGVCKLLFRQHCHETSGSQPFKVSKLTKPILCLLFKICLVFQSQHFVCVYWHEIEQKNETFSIIQYQKFLRIFGKKLFKVLNWFKKRIFSDCSSNCKLAQVVLVYHGFTNFSKCSGTIGINSNKEFIY